MPSISSRDDLKIKLASAGYADLANGKTAKTVVVQIDRGGDRIGTLEDIAKKLKSFAGKYNPKGGQSSVGRTELGGGYYIECKIKGGGGSGAGSDLTKLTESAQCVYNAALYKGKSYSHADLKSKPVRDCFDVDEKLENVLSKLPDEWVKSSMMVAEKLKKQFPAQGKNYIHHRGSTWVDTLENHWKDLNNEAGKPFANLNKWSPADIWMVSTAGARIDITKTKTLVELNNLLIKQLKSKDIIGVSLKKVVGTAKYKELNINKNRPVFKFEKTSTGLRGFFDSGDGYMFFDGGKAQFRTFGSTWQGELKGKNANMGKMSGGPIKTLIENISGKNFIAQKNLDNRTDDEMEMFYKWYTACPDTPKMSKFDFFKKVAEKDQNWYVSKIMTTQLISMVEALSDKDKDRFSSGMVNYAGSESELSGPYVKVY